MSAILKYKELLTAYDKVVDEVSSKIISAIESSGLKAEIALKGYLRNRATIEIVVFLDDPASSYLNQPETRTE